MANWRLLLCGSLGLSGCSQFAEVRSGPPFIEMTETDDGKWLYFTSLLTLKGQPRGNV